MYILVTGGCGFIGSNFVRYLLDTTYDTIVNLDKLTYAGNSENLCDVILNPRYEFCLGDIADKDIVEWIFSHFHFHTIYHLAAESHVDNSIADAAPFLKTNVLGTVNLLEAVRKFCPDAIFVHVSTDEVYGSLTHSDPPFNEKTSYDPRSPYSASKAASDHFVSAYYHTHGLKTIITNCSNNYGPYQHPEKFIPTVIRKALTGQQIPVYGTGSNVRDWIHVSDHCKALTAVAERGKIGEKYCIGGEYELENLTLARHILDYLGLSYERIDLVEDRKGHDFRYAINNAKLRHDTGWYPQISFEESGIEQTIEWYRNNMDWVNSCLNRTKLSA